MPLAKPLLFLTPYNFDPDAHSEGSGLACEDPSRAIQSDAQQADINFIVKQFGLTGKMPETIRLPTYDEVNVGLLRVRLDRARRILTCEAAPLRVSVGIEIVGGEEGKRFGEGHVGSPLCERA